MSKQLELILALALAVAVTLPVLAQEAGINANANANTNTNVNTPVPKPFWVRPIFLAYAEIKTIDGQTITVVTKDRKTYTVTVTDKTKLLRKYGAKSNLGEFAIGNILQIYGRRTADAVIVAQVIRNNSIQKKNASFLGIIQSLDTAGQKFALKPASRALITVSVGSDTKIMYRSQSKTLADLTVGSKVVAQGVWDKSNDTLTEVAKIVVVTLAKPSPPPASSVQPGSVTVNMTTSGFSPVEIKIAKGTTVNFVNQDSVPHWPASAPHPTHTLYPEFNPKKNINPGETWSFTFNKVGTWRYHDHLNPGVHGTVIVTEAAPPTPAPAGN